jgi:O-antigen/teichoic acid export membrane protein
MTSYTSTNTTSLKRKSFEGAFWSLAGYGCSQLVRLASNVILARLLAPEYFGLTSLIMVLMIGLAMFSDIGIGPSIIQSSRGDDPEYLNTAFTIQFLRGCAIWLVCVAIAYPFSIFYHEPQFIWLVPISGLTSIISGLNSTRIFTAYRRISLKRTTLIEFGTQLSTLIVTVTTAYIHPSIWALVFGSLFGNTLKMVASHLLLPGPPNRFLWNPEAARSLARFGRWIFISTILSFASNSAGSMILGKFVTMSTVGIFSIAVTLSKVVDLAYEQISSRVLMPVFASIKTLPLHEMRSRIFRVRLAMMAAFLPPLWIMVIFGKEIVWLLFDHRYQSAGWILQVFAAFSIPTIVNGTAQFYSAKGDSFTTMKISAVSLIAYLLSMYIGWTFFGERGLIVGMAAYSPFVYAFDLYAKHTHSILMPKIDLIGFGSSLVVILLGLQLTGQLHGIQWPF